MPYKNVSVGGEIVGIVVYTWKETPILSNLEKQGN